MEIKELLRKLPAVDQILNRPEVEHLLEEHPRRVVVEKVREVLEDTRQTLLDQVRDIGETAAGVFERMIEEARLAAAVKEKVLASARPSLRPVVNATGVVLHTNLGRSVLGTAALEAVQANAAGYSSLELDLKSGERGSRYSHVEELLCKLTGAEAALVVNNNAAAVLLALGALAVGREVVVSRGQLVEIGGAFRVPDVMVQSGCILKEVGTTNKTRIGDYRQALGEKTGLLLKVHTSNYRVVGFTEEVALAELAALGREFGLPVVEDLGSGFLVDLQKYGIGDEPTVQASVAAGADVVTFSGDKLLGGPQAGIVVGKVRYIDLMKRHPLTRALRIDKMTLAALEATLREYLDESKAICNIPTLRMLTIPLNELETAARALEASLQQTVGSAAGIDVAADFSQVGGGAMPLTNLPTRVVRISPNEAPVQIWAERLRCSDPAVVVRIQDDRLILDPRTMLPGDQERVVQAVRQICTKELA